MNLDLKRSTSTTVPDREENPCKDRPAIDRETPWKKHRIKAPGQDNGLLAIPSLDESELLTIENAKLIGEYEVDVQGRTLHQLRSWVRADILQRATRFTSRLIGESLPLPVTELMIVDGHQPQLFHPGVWVKNFAIGRIAESLGATSLHLIVDNDSFSKASITVPCGTREHPELETVTYDSGHLNRPWEGARIKDINLFSAFAADVSSLMAPWNVEPLLGTIWPEAVERAKNNESLPICLTAARHTIERRWGLRNLELPMSEVCDSEPFLWFASHLLANARCLRRVYNDVLSEYRAVNKVRSQTHPVPELKEDGEWVELPLWIWREGELNRHPVYVRQNVNCTELRTDDQIVVRLDLHPESDADRAVEQLQSLSKQGYRIRSRALTTTLFARLFMADLFVHGIGGSKYDEMTDRIISRFYGLHPPRFMTLSATHRLPLGMSDSDRDESVRSIQKRLRELDYKPDRMLADSTDSRLLELVQEKKNLIEEQQASEQGAFSNLTRGEHRRKGYARFRRLRELNHALQAAVAEERQRLHRELGEAKQRDRARGILNSREYSFCLFPEAQLSQVMKSVQQNQARD